MYFTQARLRAMQFSGALALFAATVGCSSLVAEPDLPPRKEVILAVTASNQLVSFNAGQPGKLLSKKPLVGLQSSESIVGIDFRFSKGVLYALGVVNGQGRLYTIDTGSGRVTQVGQVGLPLGVALAGDEFGFDFNPTVDRIRVVSNTGQNLRLHPDLGSVVDADPNQAGVQLDGNLSFDSADSNAARPANVMAAAYTYNKVTDKITTNFAIDGALDLLITQGSREGVTPAVSPNTGRLFSVGKLGFGAAQSVSFDIADLTGAGFAAFTRTGAKDSKFYLVNLETGTGTFLGTIGGGETVRGITFEP